MKGFNHKRILNWSALSVLSILSSAVYASGYKLEFQSPSVLADAGEAAVVEDAGTNWYNSAGLVYVPRQLTMSAIDVYQHTRINGNSTAPSPFGAPYSYTNAGPSNSYPNAILPAFHFDLPFKENQFAFGLSVVPAWGLMESYGNNAVIRYNQTRIYTKTIDVAPSLAIKITDKWSLGLGPDFHYFSVQNNNHARTQGPAAFGGTTGDSFTHYTANDWGTGWHAGILFRLNDTTRFGLNYRSKIVQSLTGYSDFTLNGTTNFETNLFRATLPMPPTTTFSGYHDINARWAIMGTIAYDQWSVIKTITGYNYQSVPTAANPSGLINVTQQNHYQNTFDFSAGTHYQLNDQWMLRGSFKYENTPTKTAYRAAYFPDAPKYGINLGARYTINKKFALDMIYGYVYTPSQAINDFNPASNAYTNGNARTNINLLGAQLVWNL